METSVTSVETMPQEGDVIPESSADLGEMNTDRSPQSLLTTEVYTLEGTLTEQKRSDMVDEPLFGAEVQSAEHCRDTGDLSTVRTGTTTNYTAERDIDTKASDTERDTEVGEKRLQEGTQLYPVSASHESDIVQTP